MPSVGKDAGYVLQPRPYQSDGCRDIVAALRDWQRVLYVLPTGAGKTVVLGWLVQQWARSGRRVLYLVHTRELVEQTYSVLTVGYGLSGRQVGVIRGQDHRENADAMVQVATVQTLLRRKRPQADIVIQDESHHAVAETWSKNISWYGDAKLVGITATPARLDGTPLRRCFEHMIVGPSVEKLIANGFLRRPRCFVAQGADSSGRVRGVRRGRVLAGSIRDELLRHAMDRNGVVFAHNVAHARRLTDDLGGGKSRFATRLLTGDTPENERLELLEPGGWLDRGERRLVVTCRVLNEGYDLPSLKLAVLAHSTNSLAEYLHQVGRVMRPHVASADGREWSPVILDHACNVPWFGLPEDSRTWSLEHGQWPIDDDTPPTSTSGPRGEAHAPRAKVCPIDGAACALGDKVCSECGYEFKESRIPKENASIQLREVAPATPEQRAAYEAQWYERSYHRQLAAGMTPRQAEQHARAMARAATEMWFGTNGESEAA